MNSFSGNPLTSLIPKIGAVIFDMDGVLVDTEDQHYRAHRQAIEEAGGALTKEFYSNHGVSRDPLLLYADAFAGRKDDKEFLGHIFERKLKLYQKLQKKEGIVAIKPAVALAKYLYQQHIPLAVGTAVHRTEAMKNLRALHIDHYFQVIVTFDEVGGVKRKPAPDIYLKVSQLLNIPSENCLVIEDSENGVKATLAAHMYCVVVPNEFTKSHNFAGAIISSFEEIKDSFAI